MPQRHHPVQRCHPRPRALASQARSHHAIARQQEPQLRERRHIVARLAAASQALPDRPDIAALLLDGALIDMLAQWAQAAPLAAHDVVRSDVRDDAPDAQRWADALDALDQRAPAISARLRLAVQAHDPAARLAHCWALLDVLTAGAEPTTARVFPLSHEPNAVIIAHEHRSPHRKDR